MLQVGRGSPHRFYALDTVIIVGYYGSINTDITVCACVSFELHKLWGMKLRWTCPAYIRVSVEH